MKIWKRIPNYSLYEASSDGEIKTFNWKNKGKEAIMKPHRDGGGYLRTMLKRDGDGKIHTIKVHRIIAQTFLPLIEGKNEVNHKNGVLTDNRVENLEWVTHQENMRHAFDKGFCSNTGENNPCASLTDAQVLEIRKNYQYGRKSRHDGGETKKQIAERYNTSFSVIKNIVLKQSWKHLL